MQRQLSADSSNTLRVIAVDSGHLIQVDQPRLVARAVEQVVVATRKGRQLKCLPLFDAVGGSCSA
jgi:hypothetical protein